MKNLLTALLFMCCTYTFSQNDMDTDVSADTNVWELKTNAFYLILGAFEVTLERSLNEESAVGVSGFLPFDDDVKESIEYYISPYYRLYFGEKYTAGFFLEGFGLLSSTESNQFDFNMEDDEFVTDFALGIGLGGKWVTKKGWIGEINFGIGRNLFNTSENDIDFVGKGGITVGYRF